MNIGCGHFKRTLFGLFLIGFTTLANAGIPGSWLTSQGESFVVTDSFIMSGLKFRVDIGYCGVGSATASFGDIQVAEDGSFSGATTSVNNPSYGLSGSVRLNGGSFSASSDSVSLGFTYSIRIQTGSCAYSGSGASVISASRQPSPGDTFTLTVTKSGNGNGAVGGGGTYLYNTPVSPEAIPDDDSVFEGWSPQTCGSTFNLVRDTECTANFILKSYDIEVNVTPSDGGNVSCIPNPVNYGSTTTCIASPEQDFSFDSWGSDCFSESGAICVLENVTDDQTVDALFVYTGEPHQLINAAVLPYARAVEVGETATAFATIINNGDRTAYNCRIALSEGISAAFVYQTTDSSNTLVGTPNTPIDISNGSGQGFAFGITPNDPMQSQEIPLIFECDNAYPAASHIGLNTFILTAEEILPPDLLSIGVTPSGDGVVRLDSNTSTGFFATAAVNIGAGGTVTVRADDGGRGLPVNLQLCETNAAGQQIICGNDLTRTTGEDQTVYYTVFVTGTGEPIAFDPAVSRLFLRFLVDEVTVGATNVAVTAP